MPGGALVGGTRSGPIGLSCSFSTQVSQDSINGLLVLNAAVRRFDNYPDSTSAAVTNLDKVN